VAVFGAGGHTGRFVVAELARRGIKPIATGRDPNALKAEVAPHTECRAAVIDDAALLDRAFAGAAAVINCAGPFLDTANAVADAAVRAKIHYLDVTAEQASAQTTFERLDGAARGAGVVIMPAMGFYGGFADLLVAVVMEDWSEADDIEIGIALDSWRPTRGTRATGARNTAERLVILSGTLSPLPSPPSEKEMVFPHPFGAQTVVETPFSEVILIARRLKPRTLRTYLAERALRDIRNPATPPPSPADASGRSAQRFAVRVTVTRGAARRGVIAQGRDIYAFTAPLVCEAAQRLITGDFRDVGAQTPGAIFDGRSFLGALTPEHLTLELACD
jgi:short subunit dehydrogenase-like uncharacterized protein